MKKILKITLLFSALLMAHGCNDILDVENVSAFDPNAVWSDENLANAYLADLYRNTMPSGWAVNDGNPLTTGANADESLGILIAGAVQTTNSAFKVWPYNNIRDINILFDEIDGGTLPAEFKDNVKGQAYFLRAWNYFRAVVTHGGVPIIEVPQQLTDELLVPRSSTAECFDFIIEDLDEAIRLLPNQQPVRGRIDKAAALAFKGRVLLFKASPQFNPDNPYDNSYWSEAYEATKKAKDDLEAMGYGLLENYGDIWLNSTEGHKEAVLTVIFSAPNRTDGRWEQGVRPLSLSKDATGGDQPIWEMVEAYPMADGYQPGSSPNYSYEVQTFWENRDPRFYETIVYNGSLFELAGIKGRRQYTDLEVGDINDGFGDTQNFERTGFYTRKGLEPELVQAEVQQNDVDWIEIRFAEVLLNYAEAANEMGMSNEAMEVLTAIRQRAGLEPGPNNLYGLQAGMSRDEIREAIYHERYIEFTFEGKRFLDLRRARRLHTDIDGMPKHGLEANLKDGLDPTVKTHLPSDFNYTVREVIVSVSNVMSTPESYYFFPIAREEIDKNPNLEQNIAWGGTFDPTL